LKSVAGKYADTYFPLHGIQMNENDKRTAENYRRRSLTIYFLNQTF
jgi:hypothetical protein